MQTLSPRFLFLAAVLCCALLLSGCKESLYSQLSEQEANEVFTALARAGVSSSKVAVDKTHWGIQVQAEDIPRAVEALDRVGLPRARFSSLGEMFKREGIVSTPNEERVRFLYGVSQGICSPPTAIGRGQTAAASRAGLRGHA